VRCHFSRPHPSPSSLQRRPTATAGKRARKWPRPRPMSAHQTAGCLRSLVRPPAAFLLAGLTTRQMLMGLPSSPPASASAHRCRRFGTCLSCPPEPEKTDVAIRAARSLVCVLSHSFPRPRDWNNRDHYQGHQEAGQPRAASVGASASASPGPDAQACEVRHGALRVAPSLAILQIPAGQGRANRARTWFDTTQRQQRHKTNQHGADNAAPSTSAGLTDTRPSLSSRAAVHRVGSSAVLAAGEICGGGASRGTWGGGHTSADPWTRSNVSL